MRVYNLSSERYSITNISNRRLKVSTIDDLNDPYELLGLQLYNKDFRKKFRQKRAEFARDFGILCFSKSWHNPVLWSHYGDKHAGVCLGFDVTDSLLTNVRYYPSLKSMESAIRINDGQIASELLRELVFMKFQDWSYEEEARIIVRLDSCEKDGPLYFYPFSSDVSLREIIIGPRGTKTPQKFLRLVKPVARGLRILKSRLAFRSYEVIRNKRYKIVKA